MLIISSYFIGISSMLTSLSAFILNKTSVTNQDYKSVMKRHDGKNTLHYLDPPYVKEGKPYH